MKSFLTSVFIFISLKQALALSDTSLLLTTIRLSPVNIESSRFNRYAGNIASVSIKDYQYTGTNLNDGLEKLSPAFVKNYGPGSLSTLSLRGTGASHTTLLWEGFSIMSPLHSTADISLVPIQLFDSLKVELGNNSTLSGSGSTGGNILIQSSPHIGSGELQIQSRFQRASFRQNDILAGYAIHLKKIRHHIRYNYQAGNNDFPLLGRENKRQKNARSEVHNAVGQFIYQLNAKNNIECNTWITIAERQLSPSLLSSASLASQQDQSIRSIIGWNHSSAKWGLKIRSAFFTEKLVYKNPDLATNDESGSLQSINEAEFRIQLPKNNELSISSSLQYVKGFARAYLSDKMQWRAAFFGSWKWTPKSLPLDCAANFRIEQINKFTSPFIATASIKFHPFKFMNLMVRGGRTYRYPGFNDLYWTPGGNPELKPEKGWTFESGLELNAKKNNWLGRLNTVIHGQKVNNWIIWLPGDVYWSPRNIRNVYARGLECYAESKFQKKNMYINTSITYTYTRSTWEKSYLENDRSTGKQLIYEPLHKALFLSEFSWKGLGVIFRYIYTGLRYTSSDNAQSLNPYHLLEAELSYGRRVKAGYIRAFAGIYNLGNFDYQIIQNRAMPGRNVKFGVEIQFKTKLKS